MMPENIYYESFVIANSLERLDMAEKKLRSLNSELSVPARIEQLRFDRTGLLVTGKVLVDYLADDEEEEEE